MRGTKQQQQHELQRQQAQKPMNGLREVLWMASVATCIKMLLMPTYHSTDFEVHRHWLALTASLPLNQWYIDETSPWTLDYPPFFAWFEYVLSFFARIVDPVIVDLTRGLKYDAASAVYFQRGSVMCSDLLLFLGTWRFCRNFPLKLQILSYLAIFFSPGLLMVDHIHFQYNGFLLGVLLLSVSYLKEGNDLTGGIMFAILLCFKHLFAIAAPVYFVYLLRHYCHDLARFLKLGFSVMLVILTAFGPFLYYGQIAQVLRRLFPFGRGLCHAYWAPNFWALYNAVDKMLSYLLRMLGFDVVMEKAAMTGGLVGDSKAHAILPQITPGLSMFLVLLSMSPCLIKIWRKPRRDNLLICVVYAYTCGYIFGWHVHEKASLHFVIPLVLAAVDSVKVAKEYYFVSIVKMIFLVLHSTAMWYGFAINFAPQTQTSVKESELKERNGCMSLCIKKKMFIAGLVGLEIYVQLIHHLVFEERLPFLPLMLISVYCSIGLMYAWLKQLSFVIEL
ncbi:hypothetical protein KP509_10G087900 [Ceratopteris richardii]|uniref:Alpha-1,3-glucosyltransferase n=1 Tax=Ceratopteris richardii TaxID=49495 RepID=A0A8T2TX59_CERRI|nr:hypothetical protein KP509_10G087900 [Ceratopteris richardii]